MEGDIATELSQRASGPLHLRLLLQPLLAIFFAMKDGRNDAKEGAVPFIAALLFRHGERQGRIAHAWSSVGTVFCIALLLDCIFQYVTGGQIRLAQALGIAIILCAIPYALTRGVVNRIARRRL